MKPDTTHADAMQEHEEINLPPELSQRFNDWIELYWLLLPKRFWRESSRKRVSFAEFDAIGRNLAKELKTFVGPDVIVYYLPRHPAMRGSLEIIE